MSKTKVIQIDGESIEVDEHCAEMVIFFNEIGLKTVMCCEGHGKPIYRIWFDVEDDIMKEFIKRTSAWTEMIVRPTNEARTKFEPHRIQRGIQGWIYKRHWISISSKYFPEGYKETWVYQAEGDTPADAINEAKRDLASMKAIYYGIDLKEIHNAQEENALNLAREYEARALAKLSENENM